MCMVVDSVVEKCGGMCNCILCWMHDLAVYAMWFYQLLCRVIIYCH